MPGFLLSEEACQVARYRRIDPAVCTTPLSFVVCLCEFLRIATKAIVNEALRSAVAADMDKTDSRSAPITRMR